MVMTEARIAAYQRMVDAYIEKHEINAQIAFPDNPLAIKAVDILAEQRAELLGEIKAMRACLKAVLGE